jgi:hypothetical protein
MPGGFARACPTIMRPGEIELSGYVGYTREIASGTDIDVGCSSTAIPTTRR